MASPLVIRFNGTPTPVELRSLPPSLVTSLRSGDSLERDPLLDGLVQVTKEFNLIQTARSLADAQTEPIADPARQLLALDAEDGSTVYVRADTLRDDVQRVRPEAINPDGSLDLSKLIDPQAGARGLGTWLWRKLRLIDLKPDGLIEEAKKKAAEWLLGKAQDAAIDLAGYYGTKALMHVIESRLAGPEGLYDWRNPQQPLGAAQYRAPNDPRLTEAVQRGRMLVLVHGTASSTVGAYAALAKDAQSWARLLERFPGGIYGYEHRTFSKSPAENALALFETLPAGAKVSLVTHSRGGLVGDLLCMGDLEDGAVDNYRRRLLPPPRAPAQLPQALAQAVAGEAASEADQPSREELERADAEERELIRALLRARRAKKVSFERYVRVACPARGTRLASDNLEVFLSGLLTLIQRVGAAAGSALGTPAVGSATSSVLGVLKRVVLEVANNRLNPQLVPGIAALGIESPLGVFLAHPSTSRGAVQMAIIAGDTEFERLGLDSVLRRVTNVFADWALFDRVDNDLVVDTDSMYGGVGDRPGSRYLYNQGGDVDHFRYFTNPLTRDALCDWLRVDELDSVIKFQPLTELKKPWPTRGLASRSVGRDARPVVVFLPGIMGSELGRRNDDKVAERIWVSLLALSFGGLGKLADITDERIEVLDLFERYYGDFVQHLSVSHQVERFAYDWRKDPASAATLLGTRLREIAKQDAKRPIRLVAHSMGGLVVRAWMASDGGKAWSELVEQHDARLLMLGTPNNGSHALVHTLLGKDGTPRKLAMVDTEHGLQRITEIIAGFPGALALLPRPGFTDVGETANYYSVDTWSDLKKQNRDRWFGDRIGAQPKLPLLEAAKQGWDALHKGAGLLLHPERVSYVYGQARETACGVRLADSKKLELLFTPEGDGSVTWESGRIPELPDTRYWYMPVEHAELANEERHFPALSELLATGRTSRLERRPKRREATLPPVYAREAPPPVLPTEEELRGGLLGGNGRRRSTSDARVRTLRVRVRADDLRAVAQPVMVGHYRGDAFSGAEAVLDGKLGGRLAERASLGLYADVLGTSALVLVPQEGGDSAGTLTGGAVVVGLGDPNGQLTTRAITDTVRAAVLRMLMTVRDSCAGKQREVKLASVLIGYVSSPNISIAESVAAVTLGVAEANDRFHDSLRAREDDVIAVTSLTFVELYIDAAISAARAVSELSERMAEDLKRTRTQLEPARSLVQGEGWLHRLGVVDGLGYWPRLMVTDADRAADDGRCPPECFEVRTSSRVPAALRALLCGHPQPCDCSRKAAPSAAEAPPGSTPAPGAPAVAPAPSGLPQRLKYVFSSQRARAESIEQQHQPGLLESLIARQTASTLYDPQLSRLLFELMVPLDFKPAARGQQNLALVVDSYSADLPWELLQADELPLAVQTAMVRQLSTQEFRRAVQTAPRDTVCIIADPKYTGFAAQFGGSELSALAGAAQEGQKIMAAFAGAGWASNDITYVPPGSDAIEVLAKLYDRPYRVLTIAGHGVFEARDRDGVLRSGVVLSDGHLLTAVEIKQMQVVPEVVFLNCCHLGRMEGGASRAPSHPNKLAASISRALIEMGVRCVVAAGWAVHDSAALIFADEFFRQMLQENAAFGEAVLKARCETFNAARQSNTWGAYQAYGDPSYRLRTPRFSDDARHRKVHSPDELIQAIKGQRRRLMRHRERGEPLRLPEIQAWVAEVLDACPGEWASRGDVYQALGRLYGELGSSGFEQACLHYQRATRAKDERFGVAITAIEQLANLEARRGEELGATDLNAGMRLVQAGIDRINALIALIGLDVPDSEPGQPHAERSALLGSALKRQAALLALHKKPWSEVSVPLEASLKAYAAAEALASVEPYQRLNRIQLQILLSQQLEQEAPQLRSELEEAAAAGRKRFEDSEEFFDGVVEADAALTATLLASFRGEGSFPTDSAARLTRIYAGAFDRVATAKRQSNSVVRQLQLLARFLRVRAQPGDVQRADLLEQLAGALPA